MNLISKTNSKLILICFLTLIMNACNDVHPEDHEEEASAKIINIVREFQRVKTYDCNKNLISDKVTTVHSPTKTIRIRPDSYKNLFSSHFRNETTGSGSGMVWGGDTITVDMANSLLNMRVKAGMNQIYYQFKNCDHSTEGDVTCNSFQTQEGLFYLRVDYSEVTLEGFREYFPSEEECKDQQG